MTTSELKLSPTVEQNVNQWLNGQYDEASKAEIRQLIAQGDAQTLTDAFYKDLEFGTGGLRGIMGVGFNRMNKYTVGMATQGLANYLKQQFANEAIKVAIAYDSRNNSPEFAQITADVFSANGIKVFLFEALRPTPELSFAIRHLACQSGIVLTASHNPKEYNGYKAYWNDGSQLVPPHDKNVIKEVQSIGVEDVKFTGNPALIERIGKAVDDVYLDKVASLSVSPELIRRQKDLKIVFTPIHGTAITLVPPALARFGFENVYTVEEQSTPDGNFPTVVYPNPEEAEALSIALKHAKEQDADLVLATDPDTDRVGIAVKNHHNEWQLLNGNQTGSLIIYYLLEAWKKAGKLTGKEYVVKTVVTTDLIDTMAADFGVECPNTLTGFKYIAEIIRNLEGQKTFIAGGEESYGYLIGDFVRDKDAVASCAIIAEMVAFAKDQGKSVFDLLIEIYQKYGFYLEQLTSITKKGKAGADEIKAMMENFRANPPQNLGGSTVVKMVDYQSGEEKNLQTGAIQKIDFPSSNVLQFFTEDGSKISARPSGTEPKIKFYYSVKGDLANAAAFDDTKAALEAKIGQIKQDLGI